MFYVMDAKLDINIEKSICFRKVFVRLARFYSVSWPNSNPPVV